MYKKNLHFANIKKNNASNVALFLYQYLDI